MDPTSALTRILDHLHLAHLAHGDHADQMDETEEATQALRDLANWLSRGGSLPDVPKAIEASEARILGDLLS